MGRPKALLFDLMGTCLDWHTSIQPSLSSALLITAQAHGHEVPYHDDVSNIALQWRQGFFDEIHARFQAGKPQEDIDETHRRVLKRLLTTEKRTRFSDITDEHIDECVQAWHRQQAWPDAATALPKLKQQYDIVVLANGTTRLQLDITKSSGLQFDMLFSSELLGMTKPDPAIYRRAMELLKRTPDECIMVAAHAYDLRAAKEVGMRTVYVQRWTEDLQEDMAAVNSQNDWFVDGREATDAEGGLLKVEQLLRCA